MLRRSGTKYNTTCGVAQETRWLDSNGKMCPIQFQLPTTYLGTCLGADVSTLLCPSMGHSAARGNVHMYYLLLATYVLIEVDPVTRELVPLPIPRPS